VNQDGQARSECKNE